MRPNADAWPNLPMIQGTETYGCEWRSDGIVAPSWPVATIHHRNDVRQAGIESQFTSPAISLVDQAALADPFAIYVTSATDRTIASPAAAGLSSFESSGQRRRGNSPLVRHHNNLSHQN
jgi:hypothetical protein